MTSIPLSAAAPFLCSTLQWMSLQSSLHSLSQISLLPFCPNPTPMRLFSTEATLVKVTRYLHFATFNDHFPGLISADLLAALDAAHHFLRLDAISSLGFQGTIHLDFLLPLGSLSPPFPLLGPPLLSDLLALEYLQVESLLFFSSLYTPWYYYPTPRL